MKRTISDLSPHGIFKIGIGLCLFFASGAASLMYQVAWFRWTSLALGNTVQAATLTVSMFMAGLGLGAWRAGRPPRKHPLRLFVWLEVTIALSALALGFVLPRLDQAILALGNFGVPAVRFALAGSLMFGPTYLMGATLPRMCQAIGGKSRSIGLPVGCLYGANTLGAVIGVLAAGFWLVPTVGLFRTNLIGAVLDFGIGMLALVLAKYVSFSPAKQPKIVSRRLPLMRQFKNISLSDCLVLLAVGISGFLALAFEIVSFRLLILIFGSTTYSFSAMLAVYLCGIGVGAIVMALLGRKTKDAMLIFAVSEIILALFAIWVLGRYRQACVWFLWFLDRFDLSWPGFLAAKFAIAGLFMLIPTFCFGTDVPSAVWRLGKKQHADPGVVAGQVYFCNTIGSVLGALFGGLVLLPQLGLVRSWVFLAYGCFGLGVLILLFLIQRPVKSRVFWAAVAVVAVLGAFASNRKGFPDNRMLSAGPYFSPYNYIGPDGPRFDERLDAIEVLYSHEGISAMVSVLRHHSGQLRYVSDGKIEADTSMRSMTLQRLQGHLPMLLHPSPERVLNIGLGAGVTLGAIACHDAQHIEVVEIEPGALGVAKSFYDYNDAALDDGRLRLIWNDGRNTLLMDGDGYDVITSDPFEPVHAAAANLYTVEHFRLIRDRLRPGGVAAQYLPLYEMHASDYLAIAASFTKVFPESLLFYTGDDTVMIGFRDTIDLSFSGIGHRFKRDPVRKSLAWLGFEDLESVMGLLVGDLREHAKWLEAVTKNTDDRSIVEYSAPKHTLKPMVAVNHEAVLRFFSEEPERLFLDIGNDELKRMVNIRSALLLALEANSYLGREDMQAGIETLRKAHARAPDQPVVLHRLADVLLAFAAHSMHLRQYRTAQKIYNEVRELRPHDSMAIFHGARLAAGLNDLPMARNLADLGLSLYPDSDLMVILDALVASRQGDMTRSLDALDRAIELNPNRRANWLIMKEVAQENRDPELAKRAALGLRGIE